MKVSREEFTRVIRLVYEVQKEVGITDTLAIGPPIRSLQPGEVLEASSKRPFPPRKSGFPPSFSPGPGGSASRVLRRGGPRTSSEESLKSK